MTHSNLHKELENVLFKLKNDRILAQRRLTEIDAEISVYQKAYNLIYKKSSPPEKQSDSAETISEQVKKILLAEGEAMHINDILEKLGIGKNDKTWTAKRNSITCSLNQYANQSKIFVKTAPSTFGLLGT